MRKILCCVAALALLPTVSTAEEFESEKFNWAWEGQLDVGGLKIPQSGNVCVSKEMTKAHLSEAFRNYDETCEVFGWNPQGEITYFALVCSGDQTADLAGELSVAKDLAELKLTGKIQLSDTSELPTIGAISATWTGDCAVAHTGEAVSTVADAPAAELVAVADEATETAALTEVELEAEALPPLADPIDVPESPVVAPIPVTEEAL